MNGVLFLVVGPSGVGKDSILGGARARLEDDRRFVFARRVITRSAGAGGEDFDSVSVESFNALRDGDAFFAHWHAHGLSYGLRADLLATLDDGRHVLANVSRAALREICESYENSIIVEVTAKPESIASRLEERGRESEADIAARIRREAPAYPEGIDVVSVANDGQLSDAIDRFVAALTSAIPARLRLRRVGIDTWHDSTCYLHRDCTVLHAEDYLGPGKLDIFNDASSVRARVHLVEDDGLVARDEIGLSTHAFARLGLPEGDEVVIERTPSPRSIAALRSKIAGGKLCSDELDLVVSDIAEDRYSEREISGFLVAAAASLDLDEIEALARARAKHARHMRWEHDLVVDKHSMGGVPGSRISMIVIPLVAAFDMVIPKTSSRAITSAAGTADAMEVVARVDLGPEEVRQVVHRANGCIAWNGRLNHSPVDDVMNAITRPLGINSARWSVASILSKKLAAGSTHVVIDIPSGAGMKTEGADEAAELARLFEAVGSRLGLEVCAKVTDGSMPIGQGIGPALEVRDVYRVLAGDPQASANLRDKALDFAGEILDWHPSLGSGEGRAKAEELLRSGAAAEAFERIVDAQGRQPRPALPGALVHEVRARHSGKLTRIHSRFVSGLGRRAGAPADKSAGVDLIARIGDDVQAGDVLFLIHGSSETDFHHAVDYARETEIVEIL